MAENPLGKHSSYEQAYSPDLLFAIARAPRIEGMHGFDVWNAYEFSWLNQVGLPQAAILRIEVPASSANIIESKSLKLYLNTYAFLAFKNEVDLLQQLDKDLSACVQSKIELNLLGLDSHYSTLNVPIPDGFRCLETSTELKCDEHLFEQVSPSLLLCSATRVSHKKLYTHLFRSLCPVTAQPDWASVFISYSGQEITEESLLAYLLSFRKHQGFHEACAERIYSDLMTCCKPQQLTVYAAFTRRGGIDINPLRTNDMVFSRDCGVVGRQIRQ